MDDAAKARMRAQALQRAGDMADRFFARPSLDLRVAAFTGTNGKTTSAYLLAQAADLVGRLGAYLGTLGFGRPGALKDAILGNSEWLYDNDGPTGRHNYGAEWKVEEKNFAAYVQANFTGESWSGNVGLRYVDIDQDNNIKLSFGEHANVAENEASTVS